MAEIIPTCLGVIAPYYNLAFVIVLLILFVYLFRIPNKHKVYDTPWKLLLAAIGVFIVEEGMTVLGKSGLISFPHIIFALFELAMIVLFMYMCLLQKQHLRK